MSTITEPAKQLNKFHVEVCRILGIHTCEDCLDIEAAIHYVTDDELEKIKDLGALDETVRLGISPTIRELRRFAKSIEKTAGTSVSFDGLIKSPSTPDARIELRLMRVRVPKDLVTIDLEHKIGAVAKTANSFDRSHPTDDEVVYLMWWD